MSYWKGKRAVVTGGSAGLGFAIAKALAVRGARVMLVARGQAALDAATDQLKSEGGEVLGFSADVTNPADIERVRDSVQRTWGGLDVLCHCAGRSMRGTILATSIEDFQQLWEINFLSAVRCVQAFGESLAENRGHAVLIGSLASKVAAGYLGAYPSSKFPLAALAQQLRIETRDLGLHTLLVCPGPITRKTEEHHLRTRYADQTSEVPAAAHQPGGGAKVSRLEPDWLAERILRACEKRQLELVLPWSPRLLFIASQISPRFGDWLLRRKTSG